MKLVRWWVLAGAMLLACKAEVKQSGTPIKLGQVIPLTGDAAESGRYQRWGAELAIEEVNAAGGVKGRSLQLVVEDDKTSNPGAVAALQRLLEDQEIRAVLGSIRSTQVQAMLPTINEAGVPVAIGGTNYGLTHSGSKWVFRFRPHDGFSAEVIAKFTVQDLAKTKIAIIHSNDAFGQGGRELLLSALAKLSVTPLLVQGVNNHEKDFTAVLTALKHSGADTLITYLAFTPDVGILAKQLRQLGIALTWVGSPSVTASDARRLAGEALHGSYAVTDFHLEASPRAKAYAAAFKAKFGQDPDIYSSWTYDAVHVLAAAMTRAKDLEPESVRQAILSIQGFPGAEYEYNFDENGDGLDHYHIVQNVGGELKLATTLRARR